jgi:Dullard-like phosphatase family protein
MASRQEAQKHVLPPLTAKRKQDESDLIVKKQAKRKQYESDLIVILDMDECLVHSKIFGQCFFGGLSPEDQLKEDRRQAQVFPRQLQQERSTTAEVESFRFTTSDGHLCHVNLRPGVERFLAHITARYETHIFTSATTKYADMILDRLDPNGTHFVTRWYQQHCTIDDVQRVRVKDLSLLPYGAASSNKDNTSSLPLHRTVLVDNNPSAFLANPHNGILVNSFETDATDTTLELVQQVLHELEGLPDVRPALEERFTLQEGLKEWCKVKP